MDKCPTTNLALSKHVEEERSGDQQPAGDAQVEDQLPHGVDLLPPPQQGNVSGPCFKVNVY